MVAVGPNLFDLLVLPLLVASAGLAVGVAGWYGRRVGYRPICRRCGYDLFGRLFGRQSGTRVCPECGADLGAPHAVRTGRQVSRRSLLSAAAVLVLAAWAWGGARVVGAISQDPEHYKPASWLVRDATADDPVRHAPALTELLARFQAGRLSDATVGAMTERVLARQEHPATAWSSAWGAWVEHVRAAGSLPDAQWRRYVRQGAASCAPSFAVPLHLRRGDTFPVRVTHQPPRMAYGNALLVKYAATVRVDGQPPLHLELPDVTLWSAKPPRVPPAAYASLPFDRLADGRHTVTLEATVRVFVPENGSVKGAVELPVHVETTCDLMTP